MIRIARGEFIVALSTILLGLVVGWQTSLIPTSPLYAQVGPKLAPSLAALGLVGLGLALMASAVRGGWQPEEEKETPPDRLALAWVFAGLGLNVILIGPAGFTIASIVLFICVARGFGSRALVRDAAIGATFALVAYIGFAKTLGINIGAGLVEGAIEQVLVAAGLGG